MDFTKEQMIQTLVSWQQTLTPERFASSKKLITEDFPDAVFSRAQELGITKDVEEALEKAGFID